jgi:hypothetical protein
VDVVTLATSVVVVVEAAEWARHVTAPTPTKARAAATSAILRITLFRDDSSDHLTEPIDGRWAREVFAGVRYGEINVKGDPWPRMDLRSEQSSR